MPERVLPVMTHRRRQPVQALLAVCRGRRRRIGIRTGGERNVRIEAPAECSSGVEVEDAAGGVRREVKDFGEGDARAVLCDAHACVDGAIDVQGED